MKTAQELYPELQELGYFYGPSDYTPILEEFGTILVRVDDDDYQGDSRVLYQDGDRYGWLQFGWGSCSGCDALQGCDSFTEVDELIKELHDSIQWFASRDDCLKFFKEHDWKGDYSWGTEEQRKFTTAVIDLLEKQ